MLGPLDAAAAKVKAADPANAVAFTATLVDAKAQYLAGLAKLGEQLPDAMQSTVDAVKVSVETDDFVSAAKARAPLDDWVAENC